MDRQDPNYWALWAKVDRKTTQVHRLICHMIDVGQTALAIWQFATDDHFKREVAQWLNLDVDDAGHLIAFWASLHDLGKASPAFQDHPNLYAVSRSRIRQELKDAGLSLPVRAGDKHARHEVISTWSLRSLSGERLLVEESGLCQDLAGLAAQVIGGHHGAWPSSTQFNPTRLKNSDKGGAEWDGLRRALVRELVTVFHPPAVGIFKPDVQRDNTMFTLITGIVSVADWLGSNYQYFQYQSQPEVLEKYVKKAQTCAHDALADVNWQQPPETASFDFTSLFGFAPNPMQLEASNILQYLALPALVVLEAPMGTGKTEAALAGYLHWTIKTGRSGLYVAMPTTATSNQMHQRVKRFLNKQYGSSVEPLLVHSQALFSQIPFKNSSVEDDEQQDQVTAQTWFLPRKKSLLWPFGVGTVDQALMSVLQTKYFYLRLLGLNHKVVIFDEVHAYDAYMSVLFERLLEWLRQIGASVIILSATLPDSTRNNLLRAYSGNDNLPPPKSYPRLTFVSARGEVDAIELTPPAEKVLSFDWIGREPQTIVESLSDALQQGGCAAVVCNTVTRAQQLFEAVVNAGLCDEGNIILFHARYPLAWREEIEQKVLDKFGPNKEDKTNANPHRPLKAIVVATQVIEQSLDLDFDVMISDHAPVDLLLQRAGRLHRHPVNEPTRKNPYRLLIAEPVVNGDLPQFERGDKFVYDEYVLLRSWFALRHVSEKQIRLPSDLSKLIEQVYGDAPLPDSTPEFQAALSKAKREMENGQSGEQFKARQRIVRLPGDEELLWGGKFALEEDDPAVHEAFQALTRSDRPGVNVVCLHQVGEKLFLEPDSSGAEYDPSVQLTDELTRELARCSVGIRRPDIEKCLLAGPGAPAIQAILKRWKTIAPLRYHRVAIFTDGISRLDGTPYVLSLTRKFGLQITREA